MSTPSQLVNWPDVPAQVYGKFIESLGASGVPSEVVERLRKTLLQDKNLTEVALKEAILAESPLP